MVKKSLKNQKGFTLIELMVVMVILGVISAIAVPIYNDTVVESYGQEALKTCSPWAQKAAALQGLSKDVPSKNALTGEYFSYAFTDGAGDVTCTATGTAAAGDGSGATVTVTVSGAAITIAGTGKFEGISD
jgi:prepilin-type N-terminal cleavage/methylation domain-containing protein